jgi:DNA-binding transcriptional LysR family regulator
VNSQPLLVSPRKPTRLSGLIDCSDVAQCVDAGLTSLRSERRKRVKVAASLTIAEQLMPRRLVSLQVSTNRLGADTPEVIMTAANSDQAIATVRDGAADLGFIETPYMPAGLRSRIVGHDELVLIVPVDHKPGSARSMAQIRRPAGGPCQRLRRGVPEDVRGMAPDVGAAPQEAQLGARRKSRRVAPFGTDIMRLG